MTYAWYGHLHLHKDNFWMRWGLVGIILMSWGIAFFEYVCQVPANKIGHTSSGGPFSLFQLKLLQEVISIGVFTFFALAVFKSDKLQWNHIAAFVCILLAVFFIFKK